MSTDASVSIVYDDEVIATWQGPVPRVGEAVRIEERSQTGFTERSGVYTVEEVSYRLTALEASTRNVLAVFVMVRR